MYRGARYNLRLSLFLLVSISSGQLAIALVKLTVKASALSHIITPAVLIAVPVVAVALFSGLKIGTLTAVTSTALYDVIHLGSTYGLGVDSLCQRWALTTAGLGAMAGVGFAGISRIRLEDRARSAALSSVLADRAITVVCQDGRPSRIIRDI
jgi:hypothetical protein